MSTTIPAPELVPDHVAVVNACDVIKNEDVVFHVEAAAQLMREALAPLWDLPPPGIAFYGSAKNVISEQPAVLTYVNNDGDADTLGFHDRVGTLPYGLIDGRQSPDPAETMLHEWFEMSCDAALNRKVAGPEGLLYYVEVNDPTQGRGFSKSITVMGQTRTIFIPDFVLPAWFGGRNPDGSSACTYMGRKGLGPDLKPFEIADGGYQIAETVTGRILFLSRGQFAMRASRHSRTHRILTKRK